MRNKQNDKAQSRHRRSRSLILRRWSSLAFLLALAIAGGIVLCPFLERIQAAVATFLAPWGWGIGIFLGVIAAAIAWIILHRFGVSLAVLIPNTLWITNPPAWPLGVAAFLTCTFAWHSVGGSHDSDAVTFSLQAIGAVMLLGAGRLLARLIVWADEDCRKDSTGMNSGARDLPDLAHLADHPEEMIQWLQREEPIEDPRQDCFDMAPYARRIAGLLTDTPLKTVALIGPYGCGKSSIVKMVQRCLAKDSGRHEASSQTDNHNNVPFPGSDVIVAEVSGWGFQEGTVIEHILEAIVEAMSKRIDCLEISTIPAGYQRMLTGSGAWLHAVCALMSRPAGRRDSLQRIDSVLLRANMRVVAFLEDVDRNVREETFLNEIASLLENLKGLQDISFVLAMGQKYQGEDVAAKLGEHIEVMAPLARQPVLRVLRAFRAYSLRRYPDDIDPLTFEQRRRRMSFTGSDTTDRIAEAELIERPIDALAAQLTSPRILKTSLRRTWLAWETLHGEIDFDDLLVCNILRGSAPTVYLLLNDNVERLRIMSTWGETDTAKKQNEENRQLFNRQLEHLCKETEYDIGGLQKLIGPLFPGWNKAHAVHQSNINPQSVLVGQPTDYWARLNREHISGNEIRDQQVLRAIDRWKTERDSDVFQGHTMADALLNVDGFAEKVEQFGLRFDGKEVRDLASELFLLIRKNGTVCDATKYPGFEQLFRLSLKKHFDHHENWVISEISKMLRVSLRFANDIYYYWRSDQASASLPTPEVRKRFVQAARTAYENDAELLANALDPEYPWSIYHLVVHHGSRERGGPGLDNEDWLWFGPVLLTAASVRKEVVIPQIGVLLTDYEWQHIRPGATMQKAPFNESIAEKVFPPERMRDLMKLLACDLALDKYEPEIRLRLEYCYAHARQELQRNRKQHPDSP